IGKRETAKPPKQKGAVTDAPPVQPDTTILVSRFPKDRKQKSPPAPKPVMVPEGVLIPPIHLLTAAPVDDGDGGLVQIEQMGQKRIETLPTLRVEGSIAGRTAGPVGTQYAVEPRPGGNEGRTA